MTPAVPKTSNRSPWIPSVIAGLFLVASGLGYRRVAQALDAAMADPIVLDQPIATLPMVIGSWHGVDVPLPAGTLRVAQNDDFVSRRYRHADSGETVYLYVSYTGRPRTMLGHRPTICYPSAGWARVSTAHQMLRADALELPCLVHVFARPERSAPRHVVLNYYVLNGRLTADESCFRGISWRSPNLSRNAARYVAQIQIAVAQSTTISAARELAGRFAREVSAPILALLPGTQ